MTNIPGPGGRYPACLLPALAGGLEALVVDGSVELFQEMLGGFQALDVGEPLLEADEDVWIEIEGPSVFFDKAGDIVGDGLVAGQGFVEGLDVAGVQRWLVLDVEELCDLFEVGFLWGGISAFRHDGSPGEVSAGEMMEEG